MACSEDRPGVPLAFPPVSRRDTRSRVQLRPWPDLQLRQTKLVEERGRVCTSAPARGGFSTACGFPFIEGELIAESKSYAVI